MCTQFFQLILSRPYNLIFTFYTNFTPFKTIWSDFYQCVPQLTPFKITYDLISSIVYPRLTSLKTIWPNSINGYPNWLHSTPYELILTLCTQFTKLTPFKTIWPDFCILYLNWLLSKAYMTWVLYCAPNCLHSRSYNLISSFYQCVPNWLLSRPYDLIFTLTQFLHCIPAFISVYPIDSFQHHMTWFLHCVHNWLLSRPFNLILSMCTQLTPFNTIWTGILTLCTHFTQLTPFKTI